MKTETVLYSGVSDGIDKANAIAAGIELLGKIRSDNW